MVLNCLVPSSLMASSLFLQKCQKSAGKSFMVHLIEVSRNPEGSFPGRNCIRSLSSVHMAKKVLGGRNRDHRHLHGSKTLISLWWGTEKTFFVHYPICFI